MVEKIRETYQKHSRNISSVSDVSVTTAEPIKRDENAEIRCVLLCDSETEKFGVFEAINKFLLDPHSEIAGAQLLHHHWEQTHFDCAGTDCKHCIRVSFQNSHLSVGLTQSIETGYHGFASGTTGEGFFRFTVNGTVFRLMLLSKDKQNVLKFITFDFLFVGIQVADSRGLLDDHIWEYEWKRLDRHSKKAVAPIILLAYFRDHDKLGHHLGFDISLEKTIEESKLNVKKIGRQRGCIPRFVDFVTGTSVQLQAIFHDVGKLSLHPGYILQQCAHINNLSHFTKILEHPDVTEKDICYPEENTGDNPIMIAAKLRHKDLVSSVLRSTRFDGKDDMVFLEQLIHSRNESGQTLLAMVALQGPELEEQKLLILRKEIQLHCTTDLTHEADQLKLQRCLRDQLKTSAEAAIILEQSRALQGIPKTERELKAERGKVWSRLFFASLLLSLLFNAIDTGSDILIMIRYYGELVGDPQQNSNNTCGGEDSSIDEHEEAPNCNLTSGEPISIQCFPTALSPQSKFGYTLFFLLVPWPFFIYEFFTSRHYNHLVAKGKEIVSEMSQCNSLVSLLQCYMKAILYCISFISCLLFWPIAVLFIKYYNDGKYYLSKGEQRAAREKKIETSEVLYSTARVIEVSLESSFQPTIQLYIIFPVLVRTMTANSFSLRIFTVCKTESLKFPMLKPDQTISIITSILSLAWCFTTYHATLKRGALDKDLAALFYRSVLFLSVLFQILGRLFILVLFSYSFGPGMYYPLLIFLSAHILLMTVLHFVFSDAKVYWEKGGFLNLSFFHYMAGNALSNIYIHNWIRMDPLLIPFAKPLQHVSTLVRQLLFDIVFVAENLTLLAIALNSNIKELQEHKLTFIVVLLGFSFLGLILKCVYYRYLHTWAWLIMDYITKKEDGHWKCLLFSNMYICGELKERELLLCCIPRPIFKCFNYLFGKTDFQCTGTQCRRCTAVFSVFLVPIAFFIGAMALAICLVLFVFFLPIFLVFILPCIIFVRCCQHSSNSNIVKITDNDSRHDDDEPKNDLEMPLTEKPKCSGETNHAEKMNDDEDLVITTEPRINGTPSKSYNSHKFEDEEQEPLTDQHSCSGASGKMKSPERKLPGSKCAKKFHFHRPTKKGLKGGLGLLEEIPASSLSLESPSQDCSHV